MNRKLQPIEVPIPLELYHNINSEIWSGGWDANSNLRCKVFEEHFGERDTNRDYTSTNRDTNNYFCLIF